MSMHVCGYLYTPVIYICTFRGILHVKIIPLVPPQHLAQTSFEIGSIRSAREILPGVPFV